MVAFLHAFFDNNFIIEGTTLPEEDGGEAAHPGYKVLGGRER
jgi:hypothetical protein